MGRLFEELKRRNVFRVAVAYAVVSWLVIQVVNAVVAPLGLPVWTAAFFIVIIAAGFPIALLLSWAYEITPEGMKRSDAVDEPKSITMKTGRTIDRIIIAALLMAVIYFVMERQGYFAQEEETYLSHAGEHTIAVLPFVNMSDDAGNEFFSDGISEEILNVLVKVDGLAVASRTSSFALKGQDIDILTIADKLGVAHVLEGSVRKQGNKVRITAQLIDAAHDIHLWSQTYDRELDDIFVIQDDIANAIVDALRETLGDDSLNNVSVGVATQNMTAYEMYLKARELFLARNFVGLRHSIELFEAAIELDPSFAKAWAGLAGVYSVVHTYDTPEGFEEISIDFANEKVFEAAEKAISLDDSLAFSYTALGNAYINTFEWDKAARAFEKSIELEQTNPTAHLWQGVMWLQLGYLDKSLESMRQAVSLAPNVPIFQDFYARLLYLTGDNEKALEYAVSALQGGRDNPRHYLPSIYRNMGNEKEAWLASFAFNSGFLGSFDDAVELTNLTYELLNGAEVGSEANARFIELVEYNHSVGSREWQLTALAFVGEYEKVNSIISTEPWAVLGIWNSYLHDYRKSQSFKELLRDINVLSYWRENGFPDQCEQLEGEGDFAFECN